MAVTVSDVAVSLGRPISSTEETAQVTQWIADARLLISARLGDLAALDQPVLDYVTREAVVERVRNPEGYQSETVDDYTYRYGNTAGSIVIRDEWWRLLDPDTGAGAFSGRPYFGQDTVRWPRSIGEGYYPNLHDGEAPDPGWRPL